MTKPKFKSFELVAEVGQAHDGSLGMAYAYVDAVARAGIKTIKFQVHIAEAESSKLEPFRVKFSKQDKTRYDYWQRIEFTYQQWLELKNYCDSIGLEFLASPFSVAAVNLLETIGIKRYKIGSGEVSNFLMLDRIARTGKPIILSSGLSTLEDLDKTMNFLRPYGNDLTLLQCTTSYPTSAQDLGLNLISELRDRYQTKIGFSDHSGTIYGPLAAVACGAELVEFHVTFDRIQFGPDSTSSIEIRELETLVRGIEFINAAINSPMTKSSLRVDPALKTIFGKSLAVNKVLQKNHVLVIEDLESKKPGNHGIAATDYQRVLGRRLARPLDQWDFLKEEDLI
jgi:N,N'-diacetyllegionaminate synthase